MADDVKILLIEEPGASSAIVADACADIGAAGFHLQTEGLEAGLQRLDRHEPDIVLCEFNGDEHSTARLSRILTHARSIPAVTYGPEAAALAAIGAGAEEHVSSERLQTAPLAWVLQVALERHRRGQATEANEARLRTLIQASADSLVIVDESGTVRFANRAAERLFNCQDDELVGSVLGTPSGDADVVELSIVRPGTNETIAAEMRVVEVEWGGKLGYIESIRDVTLQKQEAERARDAIRMRDHFLATLSHELRNPLAALTSAAEVLLIEHGQFPALKLPVEIIQQQCHHMVRLLDDLLDIARISQGKVELRRECVSLCQALRECLQVMRPRIEHAHRLKTEIPTVDLYVNVDPARIHQVLSNLLTNAVKYTPHGGQIGVELRRDQDEATLVISDEGHGIPAELLESIFEPFVQAEQTLARSDGGLGIGLAVVRRLVELHGGRVRATSSGLGHGSQFVMSLPLTRPATGETASASPVCAKRLRVCVVEDITAVAWMMRKLLETLGHEVMMAPDGERGIELILERCPDVVFLDIGLPGLNGYEVAEHIRSDPRCREITLVALTGYGQPDERQRAFDAGFKYHFVKPISLASLQACLVEIANQGP